MLPCVVMFVSGVAVDRVVGFDQLGATDNFPTSAVRRPPAWPPAWLPGCQPACLPACVAALLRRHECGVAFPG